MVVHLLYFSASYNCVNACLPQKYVVKSEVFEVAAFTSNLSIYAENLKSFNLLGVRARFSIYGNAHVHVKGLLLAPDSLKLTVP